jgi:hypothetical protein
VAERDELVLVDARADVRRRRIIFVAQFRSVVVVLLAEVATAG